MEPDLFYIVGCSQERDGGIGVFETGTGGCVRQRAFTPLRGANYLAAAADGKTFYASGSDAGFNGYVAALRVGANGELAPINQAATGGLGCCHLCLSPDGRRLYAANYRSGSVAGFLLDDTGAVGARCEFDQHAGHGVNPVRQEGPHAHFCGFDPAGNFLLVNDLGLDTIFAYHYTAAHGIDTGAALQNTVDPAGSGPRHLCFEPEGTCLLVNEMGNTLQRFNYAEGRFTPVAAVPTLPAGTAAESKAAALLLSPDGRFVRASNRGCDSIAVFARRTSSSFVSGRIAANAEARAARMGWSVHEEPGEM